MRRAPTGRCSGWRGARPATCARWCRRGGSRGRSASCARPGAVDDLHPVRDAYALITFPHPVGPSNLTVPAFNLTALLDTAPKVLLNVQGDDYGTVEERACGCALESVLPARFGGSALDYQLVEEEDRRGFTRLFLVVSPRVAIADEAAVVDLVLRSLTEGASSMAQAAMADAAGTLWRQARTLQIRRAEPVWTDRGKVLPLRVERRAGPS